MVLEDLSIYGMYLHMNECTKGFFLGGEEMGKSKCPSHCCVVVRRHHDQDKS